eukprot:5865278-Pleurochrysis_carterae.AAC.5
MVRTARLRLVQLLTPWSGALLGWTKTARSRCCGLGARAPTRQRPAVAPVAPDLDFVGCQAPAANST